MVWVCGVGVHLKRDEDTAMKIVDVLRPEVEKRLAVLREKDES